MKTERKYRKGLTKDHWMCRIQKWAFNIDAPSFYTGYCPFFWMTWLAVLSAPVIAAAKLIGYVLGLGFGQLSNHVSHEEEVKPPKPKPQKVYRPKKPSDRILADMLKQCRLAEEHEMISAEYSWYQKLYYWFDFEDVGNHKNLRRLAAWFEANADWEKEAKEAEVRLQKWRDEQKAKRLAAAERNERLKKFACKASIAGRFIARLLLIPAAYIALWAAWSAGKWMVLHWLNILGFIGLTITILGIGFAVRYYLEKLGTKLKESDLSKMSDAASATGNIFVKIWNGIVWCGYTLTEGIVNLVAFLATTVKLTYKAECPMIIWGDETTPIEKNSKESVQ